MTYHHADLVKVLEKNVGVFGDIKGQTYDSLASLIIAGIEEIETDRIAEAIYQQFESSHFDAELTLVVHPSVYFAIVRAPKMQYRLTHTPNNEPVNLLGVPILRNVDLLKEGEWRLEDPKRNKKAGGFVGR